LDERRKLQAKLAAKKLEDGPVSKPGSGTPGDDMVSESTVTLQGSTTQDSRRSTLPTLLPDEILNAEPVARPPTPPAEETGARAGKPNKLKFLDKVEKPPKDVSIGDVMIRVLDEPPSQKKSKPSLPPKASKTGRSSKDNWLKNNRSTAQVNGLRRTAGGKSTSSFVRK
jgi:U3 small nucleolar RNA-associated protein 16